MIEQRETRERRRRNPIRQYKIQEVIKRRQILLVQVVKEERGNKGAALTTYLSLAGRYCVLMPNAGRGGGISPQDLQPGRPQAHEGGAGRAQRAAGHGRDPAHRRPRAQHHRHQARPRIPVAAVGSIREITMRSTAPALIYEEGDLIKRSLRDVYDTDIAQVLVEGEAGFDAASAFTRQLVPHQASKVELYKEPIPLFHRYQVENQFDAMHSPVVQLRSGGYIVINPTEALVAIDVNSGRSTKERNIEETALSTNIEAAEEVARQVRLRDLAGLIVIDFIDMEETRHQRQVEHKVKDAMRHDRARIQIGRISAFGLLEMSRQRLRPSPARALDRNPPALRRHRPHPLDRIGGAACAAHHRGGRRAAAGGRDRRQRAAQRRALSPEPEAPHPVGDREALRLLGDHRGRRRAACRRLRDRARAQPARRPRAAGPELARASYEEVSDEAPTDEAEGAEDREAGDRTDERGEREDGDREGGRRRRRRRRRRSGRRDEDGDSDRPQAMGSEDQPEDRAGHRSNGAADEQRDERERRRPADEPHGEGDDEPVGDAQADGEGERGEERADDGRGRWRTRRSPPPARPPRRASAAARERRRRGQRSSGWRSRRGAGRCRAAADRRQPCRAHAGRPHAGRARTL